MTPPHKGEGLDNHVNPLYRKFQLILQLWKRIAIASFVFNGLEYHVYVLITFDTDLSDQ